MENSDSAVAEFDGWLKELMVGKGSDLHVKVGSPPMIRLPGGLEGCLATRSRLWRPPRSPSIIPADRKEAFDTTGEIDFAYSLRDVGRFRANVFKQRARSRWCSAVCGSVDPPSKRWGCRTRSGVWPTNTEG